MKTLITGGAGFIGSHLREEIEADTLDWYGKEADIKININSLKKEQLANYDRVYHLAALIDGNESIDCPVQYWNTNVEGTKKVIAAMRPDAELFFASSCAASNPINPYGLTKRVAEYHVFSHGGTSARFYNVFGERQRGGVIVKFIRQALANEPLTIYGDGGQIRDFIYVKDLVRNFRIKPGIIHIGSSVGRTISSLAKDIVKMTGSNSEVISVPNPNLENSWSISSEVISCEDDEWIGFLKGLHNTINWCVEEHNKEVKLNPPFSFVR